MWTSPLEIRDLPESIASAAEGNVVVVGNTDDDRVWAALVNGSDGISGLDGSLVWAKRVDVDPGGALAWRGNDRLLAVDSSGDILLIGHTETERVLLKLSGADGSELWGVRQQASLDFRALALDGAGNAFVSVEQADTAGASVRQFSGADGSLLWESSISFGEPWGLQLAVSGDSELVLAGDTVANLDRSLSYRETNAYVMKLLR